MRRSVIRSAVCILLLLSLPIGASCTHSAPHYTNTVNVDSLAEELKNVLLAYAPSGEQAVYLHDDSNLLSSYLTLGEDVLAHCIIYAQDTANLDEFGVFYVKDTSSAKELKRQLLQEYLHASYEQNSEWYDSYMPLQTPKLKDAEVRVLGNYVIYCILAPDAKEVVFDTAARTLSSTLEAP